MKHITNNTVVILHRHISPSQIRSLPTECGCLGSYAKSINLLHEGETLYALTHLQVYNPIIRRLKPGESAEIMHHYCKRYSSPWYDRYEGSGPRQDCSFYVGQPPVKACASGGSGNSFCIVNHAEITLDHTRGFSLVASGYPDNYAKEIESWTYFICATDEQLLGLFPFSPEDTSLGMLGRDYEELLSKWEDE